MLRSLGVARIGRIANGKCAEAFVLVNNYEFKPPSYRFEAGHAGELSRGDLRRGPITSRARIERLAIARS